MYHTQELKNGQTIFYKDGKEVARTNKIKQPRQRRKVKKQPQKKGRRERPVKEDVILIIAMFSAYILGLLC